MCKQEGRKRHFKTRCQGEGGQSAWGGMVLWCPGHISPLKAEPSPSGTLIPGRVARAASGRGLLGKQLSRAGLITGKTFGGNCRHTRPWGRGRPPRLGSQLSEFE